MPSTAGRVRMPHNNRVSSSSSLKMNSFWTDTIGYDPYAAGDENTEDAKIASEQAAGLLRLAKMSNLSGSDSRGACRRCGMVGHLTFQCRNPPKEAEASDSSSLSSSSDEEEEGAERTREVARAADHEPEARKRRYSEQMDDPRDSRGSPGRNGGSKRVRHGDKDKREKDKKHKKEKDKKHKKEKDKKHKKEKDKKKDRKSSHRHSDAKKSTG